MGSASAPGLLSINHTDQSLIIPLNILPRVPFFTFKKTCSLVFQPYRAFFVIAIRKRKEQKPTAPWHKQDLVLNWESALFCNTCNKQDQPVWRALELRRKVRLQKLNNMKKRFFCVVFQKNLCKFDILVQVFHNSKYWHFSLTFERT